jgi:hypothetical protein
MDTIITIFKYLSLFIGSISGVIGLLSDFRNKKTNKITKNGYRLLWLIVISAFISTMLQTLELYRDKKKDELAEKRNLEESVKTNQMLSDLNRTLNPIKDIRASYTIRIPLNDPKLNSYRLRLTTQLDSIIKTASNLKGKQKEAILSKDYGIYIKGYRGDSIFSVELLNGSLLLPDKVSEALAYYVLNLCEADYSFFNSTVKNISDTTKPDFKFSVATSTLSDGFEGVHRINYNLTTKSLYIDAFLIDVPSNLWSKTGKIISIPDLSEAKLIIDLSGFLTAGDDNMRKQLYEVRKGFILENSFLIMSEGREMHFKGKGIRQINKKDELPKYLFSFPKNLEEISTY